MSLAMPGFISIVGASSRHDDGTNGAMRLCIDLHNVLLGPSWGNDSIVLHLVGRLGDGGSHLTQAGLTSSACFFAGDPGCKTAHPKVSRCFKATGQQPAADAPDQALSPRLVSSQALPLLPSSCHFWSTVSDKHFAGTAAAAPASCPFLAPWGLLRCSVGSNWAGGLAAPQQLCRGGLFGLPLPRRQA